MQRQRRSELVREKTNEENEEGKGTYLLQKQMSLPYASLLCRLNLVVREIILIFSLRSGSFSQLARVSVSFDALFQGDIEAVLDGIVAASIQEFGDSTPSIAKNTVLFDDDFVFLFGKGAL